MSIEGKRSAHTYPTYSPDEDFFTLKGEERLYIACLKEHGRIQLVSKGRHRGIVAHEMALADLEAVGSLNKWIAENGLAGQLRMHYTLGTIETPEGIRYSPGHTIIICPSKVATILQTAPDILALAPGDAPMGLIN